MPTASGSASRQCRLRRGANADFGGPQIIPHRWDVKYQARTSWDDAVTATLRPLGSLAKLRSVVASADVPLGSISFNGQITVRQNVRKTKGKLWMAVPGDVVFSRIDVRNGAIGVLGDEAGHAGILGRVSIYDLAEAAAVRPNFMRLLCRTAVFRAQVNAQVVGHTGRKRLPAVEFEKLLVPVPSLAEQDALLSELEERSAEANSLREQALPLIADAGSDVGRARNPRSKLRSAGAAIRCEVELVAPLVCSQGYGCGGARRRAGTDLRTGAPCFRGAGTLRGIVYGLQSRRVTARVSTLGRTCESPTYRMASWTYGS